MGFNCANLAARITRPMKKLADEEIKQIVLLAQDGLSLNEIARRIGRSRSTVTRYLFPDKAKQHSDYCKSRAKQKVLYDNSYYESNREKRLEQKRQWREKNKAYAQERCANYLALRRGCPVPFSEIERLMCVNKYQESIETTLATGIKHEIDHIAPMSKGGPHLPWNLRVITSIENKQKYNFLP